MLFVLSLAVTTFAAGPVWIPVEGDVTITKNVELPSPNELELESFPAGCASIITTDVAGERTSIPTRRCPRALFTALKEQVPDMEFEWTTPVAEIEDVVIRVAPIWPDDPDQKMTLRVTGVLPGTFDPPAKFPGAVKKLPEGEQHCTMRVRLHKAGNAKLEAYDDCSPKIEKAAAKAIEAWRWEVPKEILPRPMYMHVRLDWYPELTIDGVTRPGVLVSDAQPMVLEHEEKLDWPEDAPSGMDDRVICHAEVEVGGDGTPASVRPLMCEEAFAGPAKEAIEGWRWFPHSHKGALSSVLDIVRVTFDKPDDVKKKEKEAKEAEGGDEETEGAEEAETSEETEDAEETSEE